MIVEFLGTGEAFGVEPGSGFLLNSEILVECGPHALLQLRKLGAGLESINMVFLSHFHGDHYFGLPALLMASAEEGREEELRICGPPGIEGRVEEILHLGYGKRLGDLPYHIEFLTTAKRKFQGYSLSFAPTEHTVPTFAISISRRKKLTYTPDGEPGREVEEIARGSDLLVAEAYGEGFNQHSSPSKAARLASRAEVKSLALVHLWRGIGEEELERAREIFPFFLPRELGMVEL